ncbi:MAG: UDP-glucose/GDP-mannose dehydrogenase family protein [bacterium]|nr:UDP-glucose/GDP-mannose dehydrogenase family protein [bacterium]
MKISVIGTGYVGLVTGTCFAELGNEVLCVDNNQEKIVKLKDGIIPIYEPGLAEMVKDNISAGRLTFSTSVKEGVAKSTIIFVCVHTPPLPSGEANLSFVEKVSREIATDMTEYKVIVDKSTVPVETGERVAHTIRLNNIHHVDFDVVSNPEFLREGSAISDSMHPDRIVIGVTSDRAAKIMKELYAPLDAPIIVTDIRSAEIIKHASNAFLATKISFANALANICEAAQADVTMVTEGMGLDKRIGKSFLNAGIGYGGSCFPKDVAAFIKIAEKYGYDFQLLKTVEEINIGQRVHFVNKIREAVWILNEKTIGILGLAFKPNTDDMRNAPCIDIISALQKEGARIKVYDPVAVPVAKDILKDVTYCQDPYQVAEGSDCLAVLTEWDEFKDIDFGRIKGLLKRPLVIDGRNIYDPLKIAEAGLEYIGMGR